ncbi:hypothetical protein [Streptomyces sp. NPDC058092]|uniref:hypothetical protein n=1 Tax=Streptomyces sp. NPDC058092 TaxID=3346336 RepID=UPI0036E0B10A
MATSIVSLAVSLTTCAGAAAFAVKARAMRIEAEKKAARAIRVTREQLITGHLKNNGGSARLVVGDRDVEVHVRSSGPPAQIGDQVARAIRRGRRGDA